MEIHEKIGSFSDITSASSDELLRLVRDSIMRSEMGLCYNVWCIEELHQRLKKAEETATNLAHLCVNESNA